MHGAYVKQAPCVSRSPRPAGVAIALPQLQSARREMVRARAAASRAHHVEVVRWAGVVHAQSQCLLGPATPRFLNGCQRGVVGVATRLCASYENST